MRVGGTLEHVPHAQRGGGLGRHRRRGLPTVELTAVLGWTEHVDLDADPADAVRAPRALRPRADGAVGALRPDHRRRRGVRDQGRSAGRRQRHPRHEHGDRRSLLAGGERVGVPRRHRPRRGRRRRRPASTSRSRSTATSWRPARSRCRCSRRSASRASRSPTTPRTASSTATPRPSTTCTRCCRTSRTSTSRTSAAARASGTSPSRARGHVDFAGILAILRDGGYDGPASVEIEFDGTWPDRRHRRRHEGRARPPRGLRLRLRMIGIAILGGGFMGQTHAGAWKALGDASASRSSPRGRRSAPPRWSAAGSGEVVADLERRHRRPARRPRRRLPADAAAPRSTAERAFAAGKHVLLEKPLALTCEDAEAIVDAAERAGRTLLVGLVLRFWPEYQRAARAGRRAARSARSARCSALRLSPPADWNDWIIDPAQSGGVAVDLMVHDFDQLERAARPGPHASTRGRARRAPRRAAARRRGHVEHERRRGLAEGGMMLPGVLPLHLGHARARRRRHPRVPVRGRPGGRRRQHRRRRPGRQPPARCTRPTARRRWSTSRAPTRGTARRPTCADWLEAGRGPELGNRRAGARRTARLARGEPLAGNWTGRGGLSTPMRRNGEASQ